MPVYIVQAGEGGAVKIGWATNVKRRLDTLQNGQAEKLVILRLIEGIAPLEYEFHEHFKAERIRGEWFRFHPDMLTVTFPEFDAVANDPAPRPAAPALQPPKGAVRRQDFRWRHEEDTLLPEQIDRWLVSSIDEPPPMPWEGDWARAYSAATHYRDLRELITSRKQAAA